ncbi:MAG TPA: cytochrome P450 [Myxococcota bacterium]|nr:cytochrome P450 [Myxococcota bacterium]
MTLENVDLFSAKTFENGPPHAFFARLRAQPGLHWNPGRPGRELIPGRPEPFQQGFWVVSRYADVVEVSRDHERFSSGRASALNADLRPEELALFQQQLLHMDPPRHTKLRKLVNRGFTPRMIGRLESRVRDHAREIVDKVARKGECDFVTAIAAELPLLVIAELLGVPVEDRWKLFHWSNRMVGAEDPEYGSPVDAQLAAMELFQYASWLADRRRAEPLEDIVSTLVHADVDGEKLGGLDFNMFFFLLVVAGNETTRNAISGGMEALCRFPAERERLLARPELLDTAVDEIVRWVSPVMQFRRTATRDSELAGQTIREGEKVVIYYGSANRDERAFADAGRFDLARDPNPHLGFGIGVHFCLGASLARMEMRLMFEELLRRVPDLELAGPVTHLQSNFINGRKTMPVRFTPEG